MNCLMMKQGSKLNFSLFKCLLTQSTSNVNAHALTYIYKMCVYRFCYLFIVLLDLEKSGYFGKPGFMNYLKYLKYWQEPEYIKFVKYPQCFYFLNMLTSDESFHLNFRNPSNVDCIIKSQLAYTKTKIAKYIEMPNVDPQDPRMMMEVPPPSIPVAQQPQPFI